MPTRQKQVDPKSCKICGQPFKTYFARDQLCRKCTKKLPRCRSCRMIMAPEYGYLARFGQQVGGYKICSSCCIELKKKGFLRLSPSQMLLPSGKIRIVDVPETDK